MLNNLERIWGRAKKNKLIPQRLTFDDYKFTTITRTYSLPSTGTLTGQSIDFPAGAIVLSVGMAATKQGAAADTARGGLDMVRIAFDLPSQDGTLMQGGPVSAAAIFGDNRQWPEKEVVMPRQGALTVTLVNLTTTVLDVDLAIMALIPRGAG